MSIIVEQNSASSIPDPSAGSSIIFVDETGQLSVKQSSGTSGSIPTVSSSNTQVIFNDQGNLTGESTLTYNKDTNTLAASYFSGNGSQLTGISTATTAGTVTTASQPNITSLGTLTSLSVNGNLNMNSQYINNLSQPVNDTDAASKLYVDTVAAQGLHVKEGVDAGTTNTLEVLTGGSVVYNNGASGVGATLTLSSPLLSLDGYALTNGDRVLIKNQANAAHNGIYVRTSSTLLTRGTDFDSDATIEAGDFVFIVNGTVLGGTGWVETATVNDVGVDNVVFQQFSGAGAYTAGTGLILTGTEFSVNSTQNLTTVSATGNITANYFIGNGSQLTGLSTYSISNGTSNVVVTSSSNVNISVAGNSNIFRVTGTGANITGTVSATGNIQGGNLVTGGVLSVTGNANVNNLGALNGLYSATLSVSGTANLVNIGASGLITATGNIQGGNLVTGGVLSVTGNANIGNIGTGGVLSVTGNANIGNIGTGGLITATGNIRGGNLVTPGVVSATGNVTGNYFIGNGSQLTGISVGTLSTLSVTGNANIGNVGTGNLIATGNVTAANFVTSGSTGNITGANVIFANSITTTGMANIGNLYVDSNRIYGDFSSASITSRTIIQSKASDTFTVVGIAPNGAGAVGGLTLYGSSIIDNSPVFSITAAGSTSAIIQTGYTGVTSTILPISFQVGGNEQLKITANGNVLLTSANSFGYTSGSGGSVSQATSKTTAVTLNKPTGKITTFNSALAANTTAVFACNNNLVGANDVVIASIENTGASYSSTYKVTTSVASGVIYFQLHNFYSGSLSEYVPINFVVIKGSVI